MPTTVATAWKWFEPWRAPGEFFDAARHSGELIPRTKAIPQYLRDAYVAGAFARIWNEHSRCEVRLVAKSEKFPDAQLRVDGAPLDFEITMADKKNRPMWEEHRLWAAMFAEGKVPSGERPVAQRAYAREAIPRVCAKKAGKHYAGQRPTHLLIYLNVGSTLLTAEEMARLTQQWKENFESIWVLCGMDAVEVWPTTCVLRGKEPH